MRAMTRLLLAAFVLLLAPVLAAAQEQAFTNRATDLKDKGAEDGRTIASLPANTEVKVLARGGGWTRVQASDKQGWVRVFHLRFPATAEASSSGGGLSGLTSALGFGRQKSQSASIATTGIRGLTPEDFANAAPDAEALRRLQSWRADKATAERFAREARLAAVRVDDPQGGR